MECHWQRNEEAKQAREEKEATNRSKTEQVTAAGNWGSIPLRNSERQSRTYLRVIPKFRKLDPLSTLFSHLVEGRLGWWSGSEMEQDPMVLAPLVLSLPFVCRKTLAKE